MARPNSPNMPPKRARKVPLGINIVSFITKIYCHRKSRDREYIKATCLNAFTATKRSFLSGLLVSNSSSRCMDLIT